MFVVGFPLAPLCALINNVIEIQIDSHKVLVSRRRPYTVRAHGIGEYKLEHASDWFVITEAGFRLVCTNWSKHLIGLYKLEHTSHWFCFS